MMADDEQVPVGDTLPYHLRLGLANVAAPQGSRCPGCGRTAFSRFGEPCLRYVEGGSQCREVLPFPTDLTEADRVYAVEPGNMEADQ